MRKALCMLATVGLMSIIGLAGAGALDYPATTGSLTVSPRSVDPGGTVTVSGSGFMPGAMVPIIITSTPTLLATVSAGGAGSFSTTMTIPASIGPGVHTMSATGASPDGGTLTLSTTLTMNGSSLLGLAFTGVNTAALAGVAAAAIAVGALFVGVTRRRSTLKA